MVIVFLIDGTEELLNIFGRMKSAYIFISFLCTMLFWMGEALIIHTTMRRIHKEYKWSKSVRISMIGRFFESVTPFGSGGQAAMGYTMIKEGIKPGHAVLILVIKSISFQFVIVFYSILAIFYKGNFFIGAIPHLVLLFSIGVLTNTLVLLFYTMFFLKKKTAAKIIFTVVDLLKRIKLVKRPFRQKKMLIREFDLFKDGADTIKRDPFLLIKTFVYQFVRLTIFYSIPFFILLAMQSNTADILTIISSQALLGIITSYIPLPGAAGGTEGIGFLFFRLFFRERTVLSVILIWRIITFYSKIFFGGIYTLFAPEKPLSEEIVLQDNKI
jgi:uncharacterized protein (TIRG00374 family)